MSYVSSMTIEIKPQQSQAAIAAFIERRVFSECAATIPGFVRGELMQSVDKPEHLHIIAHWRTATDIDTWLHHATRLAQLRDLSHFANSVGESHTFTIKQSYPCI